MGTKARKMGTKWEQKREKKKVIPKEFDPIYSAEKAVLRVNYNKHLIDLTLNSPTVKISHSENIMIDKRVTKTIFWKQQKLSLDLSSITMPKQKTEQTWILLII